MIGARLTEGSLGLVQGVTPQQRADLAEPGAVVVEEADRERLGIRQVNDRAEILGHQVRIVGLVRGLKGLNAPYIFCSLDTARRLLGFLPDQTTYLLGCCRRPGDAQAVAQRLQRYPDLACFTRSDFSQRTQRYWLTKTPGGLITSLMAALSLLIGAGITQQTLYAATLASLREYALLRGWASPAGASARWSWRRRSGLAWRGLCCPCRCWRRWEAVPSGWSMPGLCCPGGC